MKKIILVESIIELHNFLLLKYGGRAGIKKFNELQSLEISPYQEIFGEVLYPTFKEKLAFICYTLAHDHLFEDGNKRTSLGVFIILWSSKFGELNPFDLNSVKYAILEVAKGNISLDNFKKFVLQF